METNTCPIDQVYTKENTSANVASPAKNRLSALQLKKFLRHLCVVTKHYYEKEEARKKLDRKISKIKKNYDSDKDILALNKNINMLLEKERKIAQLGVIKKVPDEVKESITILNDQIEFLVAERERLMNHNNDLRATLEAIKEMENEQEEEKKPEIKKQVKAKVVTVKKKIQADSRKELIAELHKKISLLESSYKKMSKKKGINKKRLSSIKERIADYKNKLKEISK
jgi:chromosome segregation ATPase